MVRSTVIALTDLEVDYSEDDFDTHWAYAKENEGKAQVLLSVNKTN